MLVAFLGQVPIVSGRSKSAPAQSSGEASDYKGYEPSMLEPGPEPPPLLVRQIERKKCTHVVNSFCPLLSSIP